MKIVIFGATSRIAQEVARLYSNDKNCEFILVGRNREHLEMIAKDLNTRGALAVQVIATDLAETMALPALVDSIWQKQNKKYDLVLTAHGYLGNQDLAEKDYSELQKIILINYTCQVTLLTLIAEKLKSAGHGTIAVLTSAGADRGKQSNVLYASAKAGLSVFTDGLRNRLFPFGVHVINLKLGFVDTPMTTEFKKGILWSSPQAISQQIVQAIKKKKNIAYLPLRWFFIMLIIRNIPEHLFKKLKM